AEAIFPIALLAAHAFGQIRDHSGDLAVPRHTAQTEFLHVRERNHNGQAVVCEAEQVESLEMAGKGPSADVLDGRNTVVGVNDLLTDLECHARTPWSLAGAFLSRLCRQSKENSKLNSISCQQENGGFAYIDPNN